MGRPKGSKNKPKAAPAKAKAKAKRKAPARVSKPDTPPDWLRKAMAVKTPTRAKAGRKPDALKEKFKAKAKARRGKTMTISKDKPLADPLDDPDFKAKDEALITPPPKGTKITVETEPEEPVPFDEVQSGAPIPDENVQALIAGTLGGGGDHHASAQKIMRRMYDDAGWQIIKALDEGTGDTRRRPAKPGTLPAPGLPGAKPIDPDKPQLGGGKPGDPDKPSLGDKPGPGR